MKRKHFDHWESNVGAARLRRALALLRMAGKAPGGAIEPKALEILASGHWRRWLYPDPETCLAHELGLSAEEATRICRQNQPR